MTLISEDVISGSHCILKDVTCTITALLFSSGTPSLSLLHQGKRSPLHEMILRGFSLSRGPPPPLFLSSPPPKSSREEFIFIARVVNVSQSSTIILWHNGVVLIYVHTQTSSSSSFPSAWYQCQIVNSNVSSQPWSFFFQKEEGRLAPSYLIRKFHYTHFFWQLI